MPEGCRRSRSLARDVRDPRRPRAIIDGAGAALGERLAAARDRGRLHPARPRDLPARRAVREEDGQAEAVRMNIMFTKAGVRRYSVHIKRRPGAGPVDSVGAQLQRLPAARPPALRCRGGVCASTARSSATLPPGKERTHLSSPSTQTLVAKMWRKQRRHAATGFPTAASHELLADVLEAVWRNRVAGLERTGSRRIHAEAPQACPAHWHGLQLKSLTARASPTSRRPRSTQWRRLTLRFETDTGARFRRRSSAVPVRTPRPAYPFPSRVKELYRCLASSIRGRLSAISASLEPGIIDRLDA